MVDSMKSCDHPGFHVGPMASADSTNDPDQDWTCGACVLTFNPRQVHAEHLANRSPPPACVGCGLQRTLEEDDLLLAAGDDDKRVLFYRHHHLAEPLCKPCSDE